MTNRPLFKRKSVYTKRRLIIFFLLSTIITVSIMTGFSSGLKSDSNIYTASDRIVMWQELPDSGTPEDYDLITNVKFTAQRLYTSAYFRGETDGVVLANLGMGIKYTQTVDNTRVVKDDTIFVESISSSSLVNVAEQRYYVNKDNIFRRPATSVKNGNVTYADSISKFDIDDYYKAFGTIPNELSKLKIDTDTILSVRDDNAALRMTSRNSDSDADGDEDGDTELTFDVPQTLVPDSDGNFSVTLELDPAESTKFSRNEVRTLANADQNPYYYSSSVTIRFTSDWTPISVTAVDNYDLAIPVLGAMNCSTTMTEVFYDVGDENGEIPEQAFFEERIGEIGIDTPPITQQPSVVDYLTSAFAAYLDGSKNLDLKADIDISGVELNNLTLSVNAATMDIRAKLGKLSIEYANDRVYITLNDIKGYFSVDKFASLMQDPTLSALIGSMGELPDFSAILGDDILATVFGDCEMTIADGVACIHMPFELTDGIYVDASLYINDEDKSLMRIGGTVTAFGLEINVDAIPKTASFPKIDDTYKCLDGAVDFVPDAINTLSGKTYGIGGTLKFNDYSLDVDAYVERNDAGIAVDAVIGAFGMDIGVKYINDNIYISVGNINIRAKLDELTEAMNVISDLTGLDLAATIKTELGIDKLEKLLGFEIDLTDPESLAKLLPQTVEDWIAAIRSLEVTDSSLDLGARIMGMPINIGLRRADGKLSGFKFGFDLIVLDKISRLSADLDITSPQAKQITAPDNYVELGTLLDFIPTVEELLESKALSGNAAINIGSTTYNAKFAVDFGNGLKLRITQDTLDLEAVVIAPSLTDIDSATVYVKVKDIKVFGSVSDIKEILTAIKPNLPDDVSAVLDTALSYLDFDISGMTDISSITGLLTDALGIVQSVAQTQNGISAKLAINGTAVDAALATDLGFVKVTATTHGKEIGVQLDGITFAAPTIDEIDGAVCVKEFMPVINAVLPLVGANGYTFGISGALDLSDSETANTVSILGTVTIELPLKVQANITVGDVAFGITYDGTRIFVNIDNKLKLSCIATKDGIVELLADVKAAFASIDGMAEVTAALDSVTSLLTSPIAFDIIMLLDDVTLTSDNGTDGTHYVTLGFKNNYVTLGATDGRLCSLGLELDVDGNTVTLSSTVGTDDNSGAIKSLGIVYDFVSLGLEIAADDEAKISAIDETEYTDVQSLVEYIKPIASLAVDAVDAKTISLNIAAKLTFSSGNYLDIVSRDLTISIGDGIAVSGHIILFAGTGTDSETLLTISFVDGNIYIKIGEIALKFDAETDIDRLYEIISSYLPDYLDVELQKLLGKTEGVSELSDMLVIIDKLKALASVDNAKDGIALMLGGYKGTASDSMLKKLLGTVTLYSGETLSVGVDIGTLCFTATPIIANGELTSVDISANLFGTDIYATVGSPVMTDVETVIAAPDDSAAYVSVIDFAEIINNLVGTFSQRTDDGSITFEITDLDFMYVEKAEGGTDITIKNMPGQSALKGKFTPHVTPAVKDEDGNVLESEKTEYAATLEMHVTLDMPSYAAKCGTIGLELYVVDNYPASPLAYINYTEFYGDASKNIGELVSIDASSVLQILAAAMDIIGVDDDTVEELLGGYRKEIDTSIFDSMDIVGLDTLKDLLNKFAAAVDEVKIAIRDAQDALNIIKTAGSIENLTSLMPDVKELFASAIDRIQNALNLFGDNDGDADDVQPTVGGAIRGERVKDITDGIKFVRGNGTLSAEVDNTLTTGADGTAGITVSEANGTVTGIGITNLDVDTAFIEGGITFVSGNAVTFSPVPTAPEYSTYSNLATVKHLLFDVMNNANLLEFGIGGYYSSDSIDVSLDLRNISGGALLQYMAKLDISIKYDIKVKIIDAGRDDNGNTVYKTAAVVEFYYENCNASILGVSCKVVTDCVTRLYFYDNVLYVQGVSDWGTSGKATVGTVDTVYSAKRLLKDYNEVLPTVDYTVNTSNIERVNVMYTMDEFFYMIQHDMSKFLKEFLFYLIPLSKDFTFLGLNLQDEIVKLIPTSGDTAAPTENTIARIFKGYNYDNGKHSLILGLKELAGSDSLSDLYIDIVGANDDDDDVEDGTLLNNYISNLAIGTSIQDGLVSLKLNATLNNVRVTDRNTIESKGFAPTDVTTVNSTFTHNKNSYIADYENYTPDTLFTLDGALYSTTDGRLYTDYGKLVEVYRHVDDTDTYVSSGNSSCQVEKPDDAGYRFGDTLWGYKHTYYLTSGYSLSDKYDYTYYVGTNADGSKYVYRLDGYTRVPVAVKSVTNDFLAEVVTVNGKIVAVNNRVGGVQWSRPWQSDYEASLAA